MTLHTAAAPVARIDSAKVQDAWHYAAAALGGEWRGHESTFTGRDAEFSRTGYLKLAHKAAKAAGVVVGPAPKRLADAAALITLIEEQAKAAGIWAPGGDRLCPGCRDSSPSLVTDTLCVCCLADRAEAAKAEEPKAAPTKFEIPATLYGENGARKTVLVEVKAASLKEAELAAQAKLLAMGHDFMIWSSKIGRLDGDTVRACVDAPKLETPPASPVDIEAELRKSADRCPDDTEADTLRRALVMAIAKDRNPSAIYHALAQWCENERCHWDDETDPEGAARDNLRGVEYVVEAFELALHEIACS